MAAVLLKLSLIQVQGLFLFLISQQVAQTLLHLAFLLLRLIAPLQNHLKSRALTCLRDHLLPAILQSYLRLSISLHFIFALL